MDLIPPWRVPHHFAVLPVEGTTHRYEPSRTYGLLSLEFADVLARGDAAAAQRRLGLEWLASLAANLQGPSGDTELGAFIRTDVRITEPGQDSSRAFFGEPIPPIPNGVLDAFWRSQEGTFNEFHERIASLLREIA